MINSTLGFELAHTEGHFSVVANAIEVFPGPLGIVGDLLLCFLCHLLYVQTLRINSNLYQGLLWSSLVDLPLWTILIIFISISQELPSSNSGPGAFSVLW